jgi:uncharacterized ferredoxin-like protein
MPIKDTVRMVGSLMELAARTAPKGLGQDFIEARLLSDEEKAAIGNDMIKFGTENNQGNWERDGWNVLDSDGVILIGLRMHKGAGLDCGACGFANCAEFSNVNTTGKFVGPNCAIRLLDLGIALGSAAKIASDMNVDNRIMYRIGVSARRLGISKSQIVHGIALSATGKNIFFDRQPKK